MKHDWEYKKLGEVCDFIGGGTPAKSKPDYYTGDIPWATVRDMTSFNLKSTEFSITKEAVDNSATNILPEGTIIISTHVGIGKICQLMQDTAINQDLKGIQFKDQSIEKLFFVYWYRVNSDYIKSKSRGATVKGVTLNFMKSLLIPVPPLSTQHRIAAELSKLNDLINLKREQLRELDNLAQSLFYTMFGDPLINPKKWYTKPFKSCFKLSSGDGLTAKNIKPGNYPVYGGNGIVGYHTYYNIDGENIIIGRVGALCGNVRLVKGKAFITDNAFIATFLEEFDKTYVRNLLDIKNLRKYAKTVAQPVISNISLREIDIPLPPIELQTRFASRITAIESQKARIERSIQELQTLLDARMDYWFN
jgi:type I restriction enzyme S subunit